MNIGKQISAIRKEQQLTQKNSANYFMLPGKRSLIGKREKVILICKRL